jgi:hypothetical protein
MQRLEVSGAVRHIIMYMSLGVKGLNGLLFYRKSRDDTVPTDIRIYKDPSHFPIV